jgi:hypothetical protein
MPRRRPPARFRPTPTLPAPLKTVLDQLATQHIELTPLQHQREHEPLFFRHDWTVTQLPRALDSEVLRLFVEIGAHTHYSVITENSPSDNGAYAGVSLLEHPDLMSLIKLDWYCPEYCDDECDAAATLTIWWALQPDLFRTLRTDVLTKTFLYVFESVLRPVTDIASLLTPDNGSLFGQTLNARLTPHLPPSSAPAILQAIAKGLCTPAASSPSTSTP